VSQIEFTRNCRKRAGSVYQVLANFRTDPRVRRLIVSATHYRNRKRHNFTSTATRVVSSPNEMARSSADHGARRHKLQRAPSIERRCFGLFESMTMSMLGGVFRIHAADWLRRRGRSDNHGANPDYSTTTFRILMNGFQHRQGSPSATTALVRRLHRGCGLKRCRMVRLGGSIPVNAR